MLVRWACLPVRSRCGQLSGCLSDFQRDSGPSLRSIAKPRGLLGDEPWLPLSYNPRARTRTPTVTLGLLNGLSSLQIDRDERLTIQGRVSTSVRVRPDPRP